MRAIISFKAISWYELTLFLIKCWIDCPVAPSRWSIKVYWEWTAVKFKHSCSVTVLWTGKNHTANRHTTGQSFPASKSHSPTRGGSSHSTRTSGACIALLHTSRKGPVRVKTLYTSNFAIKEIKGRTIVSDKQNLENKAFGWVSMHLKMKIKEKFKLETKLTKIEV